MPIPVFVSEIIAATTDTVKAGSGTTQIIPSTVTAQGAGYFLFSSKSTAGSGRSFLSQLKASADASNTIVWTFALTNDLKIRVTHDVGSTQNLTLGRGLAWNLGFAMAFGSTYPPDPTLTITIPVPTGPVGYVAEYRSPWLWCPERMISSVGPELFDPSTQAGVQFSDGDAGRAPDSTANYVTVAKTRIDATFVFKGVNPMYRARHNDYNYTTANAHEREDFETWWFAGPRLGRRCLMWRDKSMLQGFAFHSADGTLAPAYVEYQPSVSMMRKPNVVAAAPPNLYYWDITLELWLTERGIAVY